MQEDSDHLNAALISRAVEKLMKEKTNFITCDLSNSDEHVVAKLLQLQKKDLNNEMIATMATAMKQIRAEQSQKEKEKVSKSSSSSSVAAGAEEEASMLASLMDDGASPLNAKAPACLKKIRGVFNLANFLSSCAKSATWSQPPAIHSLLLSGIVVVLRLLKRNSIAQEKDIEIGDLQEMLALYLLSSSPEIFSATNSALYGSGAADWSSFASFSALCVKKLLPPHCGTEIYRGISQKFDRNVWEIGKTVLWPTFTCCTANWQNLPSRNTRVDIPVAGSASSAPLSSTSNFSNSVIFAITTSNAFQMADFSETASFGQIVLPPNTSLTVRGIYLADVIALSDPGVRDTLAAKEEHLAQAEAGRRTLLVVLSD